jgi:hypothetical protein
MTTQEDLIMYVVTNRRLYERRKGLAVFGMTPNEDGPNELRLVKVTRQGADYEIEPIKDKPLTRSELKDLKERFRLDLDDSIRWYPSLRVACELMEQAARQKRHLLIFVHGYNNDMADVLETAEALEAQYNVIAVPFSWPADGGGTISGTTAYLDDKRDARVSMDALNRFLGKSPPLSPEADRGPPKRPVAGGPRRRRCGRQRHGRAGALLTTPCPGLQGHVEPDVPQHGQLRAQVRIASPQLGRGDADLRQHLTGGRRHQQ